MMTEAVTVTLSPEIVRMLDVFRQEEDSGYEEVISRVLGYLTDADNYVTDEEVQEILAAIAEGKEKGSFSSQEIRAMIENNLA
ncbi:hypothetical protein [Methanorbis rubei]|uniref:Uncharacterized protein n=1 Tax=Methanorbis rubei TaxID=3028300 RepID=A0AAE4SBU6_9EURY|nr:hypothetical protein [Methanocorpusculaceae archaeon Cs1]